MKRMNRIFLLLILMFVFTFDYGQSVFAQAGASEEFTLEEITVTAQKREENQQKVAIAMEVISGDEIKELGKSDIDEILNNISSVLINTSSDGLRVSIRGMSNDAAPHQDMQTSKPTVAVNKDGIYTNRNTGNANLFDIERVEVLYGPQSTLYASASPGGIVNVLTADPKTDNVAASGSIEYGNYNLLKSEGSVNAPISDTMALRAAFSSSVHDGYLSNGGDDMDSKAGRVKFLFKPNDKFSIVTTGEVNESIGQGYSLTKVFIDQDDAAFNDGTPLKNPWTSASTTASASTKMGEKRISAHVNYDFGYAGAISVIPSYTKATNYRTGTQAMMGAPGAAETMADSTLSGKAVEKGIELRMASSADFIFKWIVGINIYSNHEEQHSWYYEQGDLDPDVMDGNNINMNETKTKALFGNLTYPVTARFRLTAGGRKTSDKTITGGWSWNSTLNPDDPTTLTRSDNWTSMEYSSPDYKIGVEYDSGTQSMLYADWSTSYRINGMGPGKELPPERLKAYTIGAKNRFFGNKLQLNASAYYYDYKNYFMVGDPVSTLEDENNNDIWDPGEDQYIQDLGQLTTGDARIYGFDLQTGAIITANDKLDFSVSYVNKKFADTIFDYYPQSNSLGLEDMSYNGMKMTNAPPWTVDFTYSHNFQLPNGGVLTPRLSYKFQSGYILTWQAHRIQLVRSGTEGDYTYSFVRTERGKERFQEAYRLGDFSIIYADGSGKWTLSCYVKNLENYALKRSLQGMNGDELRLGPPRTYGAVLSVSL